MNFCISYNDRGLGKDGEPVIENLFVTDLDLEAERGWLFEVLAGCGQDTFAEAMSTIDGVRCTREPDAAYLGCAWKTLHVSTCERRGECVGCQSHWEPTGIGTRCGHSGLAAEVDADLRNACEAETGKHFLDQDTQGLFRRFTEMRSNAHEAYKLHWMISHGRSLGDLLWEVAETETGSLEELGAFLLCEKFEAFEEEGFDGEIWPCFDEFMEEEYADADLMRTLLSREDFVLYERERRLCGVTPVDGRLRCYPSTDPEYEGQEVFVEVSEDGEFRDLVCVERHYELDESWERVYKEGRYDILVSMDGCEFTHRVLVDTREASVDIACPA